MRFADPFSAPGQWYRGNLHTHTTRSDGALEPEEVVRRYRQAGYDFLALTDHNVVTELETAFADDFLVLLGTELDGGRSEIGGDYHVVAFGLATAAAVPKKPDVPEAVAWTQAHGGETILAHPYWSGLVLPDLLSGAACLGVEVFNTGCHLDIAKGCSAVHWDDLLNRGRWLWGFAVDDSHHGQSDHHPTDTAQAWVSVKAPALSRQAIMHALRAGLFYSSWGPSISRIAVAEGAIAVETSPVKEINFVSQRWAGASFHAPPGRSITRATFRLRGDEEYVRVECRDAEGRWAWAQPVVCVG